jgi:probable poly-beta-1,6-N-acetyl-D-glucosamine export protein
MHFKFVDLIRFFSMVSIVFCHTLGAFYTLNNISIDIGDAWLLTPMKFGTICFYLISGFLLGEKFTSTPALTYLKRRFDNTFRPYIITVACFIALGSVDYFFGVNRVNNVGEYGAHLVDDVFYIFFYTNYWFIINFFISLSILLLFKRYLFTFTFFIAVLSLTILYSINIYFEFFDPRHTVAVFGFIFYLWLGIFINRYKNEVIAYIDKTHLAVFLIGAGVLTGVNIYEAYVLKALHAVDPFNTLKISNQLYSLLIFFLFIKIRHLKLPAVFNPKRDTYGIYLYHPFALLILPKAAIFLGYNANGLLDYILPLFFLAFVLVYSLTLLGVKCLNNPPSKWFDEVQYFIKPQQA